MNVLDFAPVVVEGGYFLLKPNPAAAFEWVPDDGAERRFIGTYRDSGAPIRDALVRAIRAAKRRVFVASFMLGDEEVIEEMIAAAERLQGGVYLITALDERSMRKGLQEYEDREQEAPEERRKNFERLTSHGVYVRGHESCHAKFAVIDEQIAIVGSANFVKNGFEWTGEANLEVRDSASVRQLSRLFTELWFEGCVWEVPPGQTYVVAERAAETAPLHPEVPSGEPSEVVWINGENQTSLLSALHETIRSAQRSLTLSTYSIVGMRENPALLIDQVREARKRGVEVRLFVRQRNAYPEQMADVNALHDLGVAIYADTRNHAKVAIADASTAVVFSANFHAYQGLTGSVEVGIRVSDRETLCQLIRYMDHAVEHANTEFVRNPTLAQLDGRLAARWCKEWNSQADVVVRSDARDFTTLSEQASRGPCLFERSGQDVRFYVGTVSAEGRITNNEVTLQSGISDSDLSSMDRMKEWMQSVRDGGKNGTSEKGFFPGRMMQF